MLCTNDVYVLINYSSFVESLFIGLSVTGLLYLRWKRPDMNRPIKVGITQGGEIWLKVGFRPLEIIAPTGNGIRWCMQVYASVGVVS